MSRLMSVDLDAGRRIREQNREKARRYRLRKKIEKYGHELAQQDMRGRHGNQIRGERHPWWKDGRSLQPTASTKRRDVQPPKICGCGCGALKRSRRGTYLPGHNRRVRATPIEVAFWAQVRRDEACWEWQAARNSGGYGWFRFGPSRTSTGAHRVAYELVNGPIPAGLGVLHRCDNPPCCNPAHLFLGTNQDNVTDKVNKGRHPNSRMTACRHGHPFDEANTYVTREGARQCRACNRLRQRAYAARRKEASKCHD